MHKDNIEENMAYLYSLNPEILIPTGYEEAVVGYVEQAGRPAVAALSRERCIEILMRDGMSYEDAADYFGYNIASAFYGDSTPAFVELFDHESDSGKCCCEL